MWIGLSFERNYDILLLDISNNEEYIWTDTFDLTLPMPTTSSVTPTSTLISPLSSLKNNKLIIIVAAIGSGAFLLIGGLVIYKLNKGKGNKNKERVIPTPGNQEMGIPTPGSQERVIPTLGDQELHEATNPTRVNANNNRHETISTIPSVNNVYYDPRMVPIMPVAPIVNNENFTNNEVYHYNAIR